MPPKRTYAYPAALLMIVLLLSAFVFSAHAEPEENGKTAVSSAPTPYENVRNMVESSLKTESDDLDDLKTKIESLDQYEKAMNATLSAISLQYTSNSNLLLNPESDIQNIIQAKTDNESAIANLSDMMEKAQDGMASTNVRLAKVDEQLLIYQKELATVQEEMPDNPLTAKLVRQIKTLDDLLKKKKDHLKKMAGIYETSLEKMKEYHTRLTAMKDQFDNTISQKKKELLFTRGTPSVETFNITLLDDYIAAVPARIFSNLKNDYQEILKKGYLRVTGVILFVLLVLVMMLRFKRKIYQWDKQKDLVKHYPWRHMVIRMASRSLPLGWTAAVLYFFAFIQNFYTTIFLSGITFAVVYVWLMTRWGLDIIYLLNRTGGRPIPEPLAIRLRWLMRILRALTIFAIFPIWLYGRTSMVSEITDFFFFLILAAWSILFNRKFKTYLPESSHLPSPVQALSKLVITVIYLIPLGGIVINLSGYQILSRYWMISWGLSLSIVLWSWLTFNLIREWHVHFRKTSTSTSADTGKNRPLMWFFIQTSWLTWLWMSLISLIFAWYFDKTRFLINIVELMNLSLTLGSLNISLFNVFEIAIVLLLTHVLTRIWPRIFQEKFLADSGMNAGIKSSITVISTYVIWMFGFLMVLNILGVDSKSMAVAFGGLGIGLGFGLQAIFNNFLSGIILLFERPIQVGDVIEVGGVWGEVKQINVRATLIQTYDNASLLIPNSEFISGQVTNWSFKDFRIRRSIDIGVAYGSDVELVQKTLFEIAESVHDVYKYPKPVVLFKDFGDSALMFQLRVWTHVDNGLTVETAIRFAIDREFREKGIEIPFPQRDVHIRSIDAPGFKPLADSDRSDEVYPDDHISDRNPGIDTQLNNAKEPSK